MRNSLISIPRNFFGPGKRGSLSSTKKTKSKIELLRDTNNSSLFKLGYISTGIPYIIPQICIDRKGRANFSYDNHDKQRNDSLSQMDDFISKISVYDKEKTIHLNGKKFKDEFIFGFYNKKWYYASTSSDSLSEDEKFLFALKGKDLSGFSEPKNLTNKVSTNSHLSYNYLNSDRICAKIVFNFLCFIEGSEYVLSDEFDPIRNWIINSGENEFVFDYVQKGDLSLNNFLKVEYPDLSHKIFIFSRSDCICALLTFYGNSFTKIIKLSKNSKNKNIFNGLICDWKNRNEFLLKEYLKYNRNN